jgi:aldehyde dehydrogenase (NAD+)
MSTHTEVNVPSLGKVKLPTGLFINNEWVAAKSGETFDTVNPATGEKLVAVSHAGKEDVDAAVAAARKAFKTTWGRKINASERGARE